MIYLDHAAATPLSRAAREAMEPYFSDQFFNPSAAYLPAKAVAAAYHTAKDAIAHAIGAKGLNLVITGSATEANNLAFTCLSPDGEALVLATEHASVRQAAARRHPATNSAATTLTSTAIPATSTATPATDPNPALTSASTAPAASTAANSAAATPAPTLAPWEIAVDRHGTIDLADLRRKISDRTELVSVALANNELGTIQPLAEISRLLRTIRAERLAAGSRRPLYLHSDASQALNLLDVNVARLGVDLLTLNAAKIYGPKGVGALYVSPSVRLRPLTVGGGQENGLRSGTENVAGVVGFAAALRAAQSHLATNRQHYAQLRHTLLTHLKDYELINRGGKTLDNFVVLCYNGIDGERLLYLLEAQGVYVATGAACAASKGEKSHVLAAIGLTDAAIAGSLRLTLGATNTDSQLIEAAHLINAAVASERRRLAQHSSPPASNQPANPAPVPDSSSTQEHQHLTPDSTTASAPTPHQEAPDA